MIVKIAEHPYTIPVERREEAEKFLLQKLKNGDLFNGSVLGAQIATKNNVDFEVVLTPGGYYDHLCTDIAAGYQTFEARSSWRLQAAGVSALAFTPAKELVVVRQSARNQSSAGLLAPSGSGTLEPQDLPAAETSLKLSQVLIAGALRELYEETGLKSDDISLARTLGCARWLQKGAKPEFFCYVELNVMAEELISRKITVEEQAYRDGLEILKLKPKKDWELADPTSLLDKEVGSVVRAFAHGTCTASSGP